MAGCVSGAEPEGGQQGTCSVSPKNVGGHTLVRVAQVADIPAVGAAAATEGAAADTAELIYSGAVAAARDSAPAPEVSKDGGAQGSVGEPSSAVSRGLAAAVAVGPGAGDARQSERQFLHWWGGRSVPKSGPLPPPS